MMSANLPKQLPMFDYIEFVISKGATAIIDPIDADLLIFKWCLGNKNYVIRTQHRPRKRTIRLHRLIMSRILGRELNTEEQVDHINGNPLDNRRANLRLCTVIQNAFNRKRNRNNTSGFKGVFWNTREAKWCAEIRYRRRHIRLGCFSDIEDARRIHDEAERNYFGEFARVIENKNER